MGQLCSSLFGSNEPHQQQYTASAYPATQARPQQYQQHQQQPASRPQWKQAPSQQQQQFSQPHYPTPPLPPSQAAASTAGDGFRAAANDHARRRGQYFDQSKAAWNRGDKAEAKRLSDLGKAEGAAMEEANRRAAEAYFNGNNMQRGLGIDQIDLHGLYANEALERVEARIKQCRNARIDRLVVIVGRGNHSKDHKAVLKPKIEQLVREQRLLVQLDTPNEGCITIFLNADAAHIGFASPQHARMQGKGAAPPTDFQPAKSDACLQM